MEPSSPKTTYRKDYQVSAFLIEKLDLSFELDDSKTLVTANLTVKRNPAAKQAQDDLVLDGEDIELVAVAMNDNKLTAEQYSCSDNKLHIKNVPESFQLTIINKINPAANTELSGLYKSATMFCTQCEAQGFRRICYYLDRPDVMTKFTTKIIADKKLYPHLLSNGNPIDQGDLDDGRHWVFWEDPFKKPSYLFALVAGDLVCLEDSYTTSSGREVALRFYVEEQNKDKCEHAIESLKRSMRWDEENYAREYDLDIYMVVAVNDFNMGAMENKGLNIFNSKFVLAKPETATDQDFNAIEAVVGHEYFHNWTGNRITCRDWFQLSLKESLTVFREQSFSQDMSAATVKRIHDVQLVRTRQFAEDAGPMAHPVRPESYIAIDNFYTMTIYEKGAEVIRMLHTILGKAGFRKGMDNYFKLYDGQAVEIDDFVAALADVNNFNAKQFKLWYSQAGTPEVTVTDEYDAENQRYTMNFKQYCPPTPKQEQKQPMHIPVAMGLLSSEGEALIVDQNSKATDTVLALTKQEQSFVFENITSKPIPSLFRNFSAPVKLKYNYSDEDLALLMRSDENEFNRWEAAQKLAVKHLLTQIENYQQGKDLLSNQMLVQALQDNLNNNSLDKAFLAELIQLPSEAYLATHMQVVDPEAIFQARQFQRQAIAEALKQDLLDVYKNNHSQDVYSFNAEAIGKRSLKNSALAYLLSLDDESVYELCEQQYKQTNNMTDEIAAFSLFVHSRAPVDCKQEPIADFYERWQNDLLVVDKWLSTQARDPNPGCLDRVKALIKHPAFDYATPNKIYALIGGFGMGNPLNFHAKDGKAYEFLAEQILHLDSLNPQVAARMVEPFTHWRRYDNERQALMKSQLQLLLDHKGLTSDLYEIVSKSLGE